MSKDRSIAVSFLLLVLVTLPLQQLWIRPLGNLGAPEWVTLLLTNWAAPVIFFLAAVGFWKSRSRIAADRWLIAFFAVALLPIIWQFTAAGELVVGWRYTLVAMLGYWIGRGQFLSAEIIDRCLRVTLWAGLVAAGLQLITWWLASPTTVALLGFEPLFAAGQWWRVFGAMSGPNQLGTFLALAGVWLYWRKQLTKTELILVCIGVILTFSRSALLGMATGFLLTIIIFAPSWRRRVQMVTAVVAAALLMMLAINNTASLRESLVESRHADLRLAALDDTSNRFANSTPAEWLVGHGAGTAGPASAVLKNGGFIPENWFLQIAYEFGVAGLALVLAFLGTAVAFGVRHGHPALVGAVLVLAVNSLFLHPLGDNFATALWFYFLIGAALTQLTDQKSTVQ